MDAATQHILPFLLVLSRISAFLAVMPVWSAKGIPVRVRAGLALVVAAVLVYFLTYRGKDSGRGRL